MNFLKRAWWRLSVHLGRTAMLTGIFCVICTLVLSGFLIQAAAARAADRAKQQVGAVATMQLDINALINSGGASGSNGAQPGVIGSKGDLHRVLVDRICASPVVAQCNYTADSVGLATDSAKLYQPVPPPAGTDTGGTDFFKASGVRDMAAVPEFRNGDSRLLSGKGIGPRSAAGSAVIEERMAERNHLKVGDRFTLKVGEMPAPGRKRDDRPLDFVVTGVYRSGTADTGQYVPAMMDPANQIYVTTDGASRLLGNGTGKDGVVKTATFTLRDPGDLGRLKHDAKAAGADPAIFPITVNDKQYRTLVGPITKTSDFAGVTVWLVAVAGTVILALIIASALRERRKELGVLLSMGERKPRLLGQHLVEILACALPAIGIAAACGQVLSQAVGDHLLAGEVSSANASAADDRAPDRSDPNGGLTPAGGADGPDGGSGIEPIDTMTVRLGAGEIGRVGATGLGIAVLATVLPGVRILRLNPRDILTKGD
ncbi:ABC transporter permease [Actinacidiphila alni]|uniref:ABC transporter permease n=1 Tax=Actinacidiphila alni TaxID=380248 RepID=UPI0034555272